MPKKCLQCSETAPDACEKDLCGRCCEPQCKPNVHKKPRRVVRGTSGRQARDRTIQSWKAANKRFRLECKNARCGQLAGELGISKKQLRRAFLCDLIEEARLRREPLQGSPTGNWACNETEALAAALLAPVKVRAGLIDDLLEHGEPVGFVPTSDFGPGSDFVPDWAVDSESDVEQDGQDLMGTVEVLRAASPCSATETASMVGHGLLLTTFPLARGGDLRGLTTDSHLSKIEKVAAAQSSVAALESSGDRADCVDCEHLDLPITNPATLKTTSQSQDLPDEDVQDTASTTGSRRSLAEPWVVYNEKGLPCAHWERHSPPLAWTYADMVRLGYLCPNADPVGSDIADVVEWLRDFGISENLAPPMRLPYEWRAPNKLSEPSKLHRLGRWYRFDFRQPRPAPLVGTDMSLPTEWKHRWGDYRRCIHSTNFYVMPKILRHGLHPGPNPGKGSVHGVYCYEMVGEALAVKSSQYCVYTSPQNDGTFWGARLELQVAVGCASATRRIHVGERQYAAFEGSY